MHVTKRSGAKEAVSFDKILRRVRSLCNGLDAVDPVRVSKRVVQGVHNNVKTSALDDLTAETAASLAAQHPDYAPLAARVSVSNLHKQTVPSMKAVYSFLSEDVLCFVSENLEIIDSSLCWNRDFSYDYFGFKTLERSYLLVVKTASIEESDAIK